MERETVHDGQSAGPMDTAPVPHDLVLPEGWSQHFLFDYPQPEETDTVIQ